MKKIMITGAAGQIGSELSLHLRKRYGADNVLATDIAHPSGRVLASGPFEMLDVLDQNGVERVVRKFGVDTIYHMAAILSATGEKNPGKAWDINIRGLINILEVARQFDLARIFSPSSIAVFGPNTPRVQTPQDTILDPKTMYGVTKAAGENLGDYYVHKFGLDVRGCRFPGIISNETPPGGGTTDYAVAIFHEAIDKGHYTCFLRENTRLPMMYMPDCLKAIQDLMDADFSRLRHHSNFNVTAMSFTPGELAAEIQERMPGFSCDYAPDFRQSIADSWPESLDDSAAREEWGWKPSYDLAALTEDMLRTLDKRRSGSKHED